MHHARFSSITVNTIAGASEVSEKAAHSLNNSGLAFRIRQRRPQSILEALLEYGTDVIYFEQTNSMLNQTPTACFLWTISHKPIHSLKQKATGYSGIKASRYIWPYKIFCCYSHNDKIVIVNRFPQWRLKFSAKVSVNSEQIDLTDGFRESERK